MNPEYQTSEVVVPHDYDWAVGHLRTVFLLWKGEPNLTEVMSHTTTALEAQIAGDMELLASIEQSVRTSLSKSEQYREIAEQVRIPLAVIYHHWLEEANSGADPLITTLDDIRSIYHKTENRAKLKIVIGGKA